MFKDTVRTNGNMCTLVTSKNMLLVVDFGFNAFKMPLILPQGSLQPFYHIDVKIMENKLLSCLRTQ